MNRYESIISAIPDLVFRFDEHGNFTDYYATKYSLLAVPQDQIIGKNISELFEPAIANKALDCIKLSLAKGKETSFEYSLTLPDGIHFFEARLTPTTSFELPQVVSFIRDITETHALKKKNDDILTSMNDLVFWIDKNGKYTGFFASNDHDLLVNRESIVGSTLRDSFAPPLAAKLLELVNNALGENKTQIIDYSVNINNGEVFFEARIVPSNLDTVVVFVRNITSRKEGEMRIQEQNILLEQQNNELLKINSEMDEFVYHTSHDLRAPLSSIMGLTEIGLRAYDLKEIKSCLAMIKDRVLVQDNVIREIMDLAKNLRTELEYELVDIKLIIYQSIDTLLYNEGADKINFQIQIPDSFEILSDNKRLSIIFNNLIANSIRYHDYTKPDLFIAISLEDKPTELLIHVEDNGTGISEAHHKKLFNMFYRASENSKGSGLGLYIVKDIVDKMKGSISFISTVGRGTRFTFSIPKSSSHSKFPN